MKVPFQERERLARLGYSVSASCVIPDLLQGWLGLDSVTGSYDTEDEVWEAIEAARRAARETNSLGLIHDNARKAVAARSSGPKCSCTPGGGYGCACPGCKGSA